MGLWYLKTCDGVRSKDYIASDTMHVRDRLKFQKEGNLVSFSLPLFSLFHICSFDTNHVRDYFLRFLFLFDKLVTYFLILHPKLCKYDVSTLHAETVVTATVVTNT